MGKKKVFECKSVADFCADSIVAHLKKHPVKCTETGWEKDSKVIFTISKDDQVQLQLLNEVAKILNNKAYRTRANIKKDLSCKPGEIGKILVESCENQNSVVYTFSVMIEEVEMYIV